VTDRPKITLEVKLDGRQVESETVCAWGGPHAFVIATTLPDHGLALELTSVFVGHEGVPTHVAHLTLGPPGHHPVMRTDDHEHQNLNPKDRVRDCVYEHVGVLLEHLKLLDYEVAIDVPDDAFQELKRAQG
jgi:hypothetical protein